jgi:hypothetical protein
VNVCNRRGLAVLLVVLAVPAPAFAYWHSGGGLGSGAAIVATMPAGPRPAASAAGRSVTVSWTQSVFLSSLLGTYDGGGYALKRYEQGGSNAITPNAACASAVSGAAATLQCVESDVPYGRWQYSVTPLLNSLTGDESPKGATVTVATAAPALTAVVAQNPAPAATTGDIALTWGAVADAVGYNVYRRTSAGSYDFGSPLNGATPLTATGYADRASGLTGGVTYDYVVRAVAGAPTVESANSNEIGDTAIARPSAPAGTVTATAVVGGHIDVAWSSVAGVAGYNVYRRTSAGSYDFGTPLNGAGPVAGTTYHDSSAANGTTYHYTVRSVITGLGGAQVESADSSESSAATSDATSPQVPSALTVDSGGDVQAGTSCGVASGTRYINAAGAASVSVTATIASAEPGESVVFSATTSGSTPVTATVAVGTSATTATTTINLSTLLDGVVTLTAQTKDAAGNLSATRSPTNVVRKDIVAGALSNVTYTNNALFADTLSGTSECGATIRATQTVGPHVGNVYTTTVGSGGTFSGFSVDAISLGAYAYAVTATDLAGNISAITTVSGTIVL